ncbi:MAG: hypothetical protein N5P05_004683 (plasmid) [Chroococcopsis gigantea SAG 12.99]|jgi:hypothetical protein|nr:hypothetical protein [Chroococcopsis gigantea SAG 12.99]
MAVVVEGAVRNVNKPYVDGTPCLEIHVPIRQADGLPLQIGERVPIRLHIADVEYQGGLRSTKANDYAWISPDVYGLDGERMTLGRVLSEAGFGANDRVRLHVDGDSITVRWG